jgi:hypothetical protein
MKERTPTRAVAALCCHDDLKRGRSDAALGGSLVGPQST